MIYLKKCEFKIKFTIGWYSLQPHKPPARARSTTAAHKETLFEYKPAERAACLRARVVFKHRAEWGFEKCAQTEPVRLWEHGCEAQWGERSNDKQAQGEFSRVDWETVQGVCGERQQRAESDEQQ